MSIFKALIAPVASLISEVVPDVDKRIELEKLMMETLCALQLSEAD